MTQVQAQQHNEFKAAKQIALTIPVNEMRRASYNNKATNYTGANLNGRMFVIGDNLQDIQNPDTYINDKPAREIFGDFSVMSK